MGESIAEVAAGMTKAQREAVYKTLILLDGIAGSGIGHEGTDGQTVWSDDVWLGLYDAFFPERGGDDESLATLARSHLISQGADHDR